MTATSNTTQPSLNGGNPSVFLDLGVATMDGTIPAANLPVGTGPDTVAAGDDPRLVHAPFVVESVAALRALPVPTPEAGAMYVLTQTYYAGLPGGGNSYRWVAANDKDDNGGSIIQLTVNGTNPGRYLAADYDTGEANAAQFGANPDLVRVDPVMGPTVNRASIQAAHDSFPVVDGYPDTASHRRPRKGHLVIPPGVYHLDAPLNFFTAVRVEGGGWRNTTLRLDPYKPVPPDPQHPPVDPYDDPVRPETYFINFEHSDRFNPADPNEQPADINNHFGAELFGLTIDCNFKKRVSGVTLRGAQGVRMGECNVSAFGLNGVYFRGEEITTLWVTGNTATGSGLILESGLNPTVIHNASVEHMNTTRQVDANGDSVPYVLIQGAGGVVIEELNGETGLPGGIAGELFLKIKDSHNILVRTMCVNDFSSNDPANPAILAYITGDSGNIHLDAVSTLNGGNGTLLIKDNSAPQGIPVSYQLAGPGYTTYCQDGIFNRLKSNSINANVLKCKGGDVIHEVFNPGVGLLGRYRLVFNVTWYVGNISTTPQYLVRLATGHGEEVTALFSINKGYQSDAVVNVVPLTGSGLLVVPTGTGALPGDQSPMPIKVTFALVKPTPTYGDLTWVTVTNLADAPRSGSQVDGVWSTEVVTQTSDPALFTNSTVGTLAAVTTDANGRLPVKTLALQQLVAAAIAKAASGPVAATDPDIEVDTTSGNVTLTLHLASGNAGLVRTISNLGGNNVVVLTSSPDLFSSGGASRVIAAGNSLRLKVNAAENKFIVL